MKTITSLLFFLAFLSSCSSNSQPPTFTVYSNEVKDSFDIYVTLPKGYQKSGNYSTVYYLDASIKSGKRLRELVAAYPDSLTRQMIFVGIGHRGNFHVKRRRDFIPPELKNGVVLSGTDADYGHADRFYEFLTNSFIPFIESRYAVNKQRTFIGHSFGGLFGFYCLFKKDRAFEKYIALSPSLWTNQYNIFEYEAAYHKAETSLPVYLYLSAGGSENFNYILQGNGKMKALLDDRKYKGLHFETAIHPGKTHNSQVPVSLAYLLKNKKL
jgi:predicted alpha/beta superfamily hydrolase